MSYNLDVFLNGIKVVNIKTNTNIDIIPMKAINFDAPVNFDPRIKFTLNDIVGLLANYLNPSGKSKIIFDIKGVISVKIFGFIPIKNIPIDISESLADMLATDPNASPCPDNF